MQTQVDTFKLSLKGLESLLADKDRQNKVYYLKDRWTDEREYEDFEDYKTAMKAIWDLTSFEFVSMNKSFSVVLKDKIQGHSFKVNFNRNGYTIAKA